ncbi:hypothetical protein ACIQC9_01050 [Brevundimonas sp. NPDC092305]|uniref:hypothetical protein n=1 Tax=Brevundimonas sp. NPDC092305 TaxID=3363957 RepID=UPI00382C0A5B
MLTAVLFSVFLQQTPPAIVWSTPVEPVAEAPAAPPPVIPEWARSDPFGYERSECSPLIRKSDESLEACQSRVRVALAANLGTSTPDGLRPQDASDQCRQVTTDGRFGMDCAAAVRRAPSPSMPQERRCESRPVVLPGGGTAFNEVCERRPTDEPEGLRFRLGGQD